jgi:N-acetylglucosaminyl-diphospho-decaprenol L-rhamnosyltransferase
VDSSGAKNVKKSKAVCSAIIVTYNNQKHMDKLIESLRKQTRGFDHVLIIDSCSTDTRYLKGAYYPEVMEVFLQNENVGFCKGNNIGVEKLIGKSDYVCFLNPDAFLSATFLEQAIEKMEAKDFQDVAILTGTLLGYDIKEDKPTGKVDSTGVFQKWYGKWYDREQREDYHKESYSKIEDVPAICGALMFCRKTALESNLIRGKEVFDNSFYMWKEDIDLSLRLRKSGWRLVFDPSLIAHHCRGWNSDRKAVPRKMRLLSAKNEFVLHWRYRPLYLPYSLAKFILVSVFNA